MRIRTFRAWRPPGELAAAIASPPYDVVDREEAARLARGNPMCFLRVSRADLEFPPSVPPDDPAVYRRAADNWEAFRSRGWLRQDAAPGLFLYRQAVEGHEQIGLAALYSVADYDAGLVRRHEHTRPAPEADRARHIAATGIHAGPVFLAFRDGEGLADRMARQTARSEPECDFTAADGVRHTVWRVPDPTAWVRSFERVLAAYIADGHHRAAAAARVARETPGGMEDSAEAAWVLALWFPAERLRILPYHRAIAHLGGRTAGELLEEIRRRMIVTEADGPQPSGRGDIRMGLAGRWYRLVCPSPPTGSDPVEALEVSLLQSLVLTPVLGVTDPRNDSRISFIGGRGGLGELEARLADGRAAVVFSMPPVAMADIMAVADRGGVMPPKSTWFDPKPRSGLIVHAIR